MDSRSDETASGAQTTHRTFCRLCGPTCGLIATVENGRLLRVRPDREHPVTGGFACNKGLATPTLHRDPDRLTYPIRRTSSGWQRVTWDQALEEIGDRLGSILERHGPRALAMYGGNPIAFNAKAAAALGIFRKTVGCELAFSSGTQDCSNKFAVSEVVYGSAQLHTLPDFDHTRHLMVIGTYPSVSKMSFVSTVHPVRRLMRIRDRGGKVTFVNPRRVDDRIGETIQLRPGTDVYLLAGMLHRVIERHGISPRAYEQADGLEHVARFAAAWPPERCAQACDVPAEMIELLADEFATADGATIHSSVGINQGPQPSVAYWLQQMLVLVTGNLDRRGGALFTPGLTSAMPAAPDVGEMTSYREHHGVRFRVPMGMWPAALLPQFIADPERPVRAMFVTAGNPVLTVPGESAMRDALSSLELLVSVDLYRNATGDLADFVLPATDMYERPDLNFFGQNLQAQPWMQWTDALVEPAGEQRNEEWIYSRILQALGRPNSLDVPAMTSLAVLDAQLAANGYSLAQLREEGVLIKPLGEPGTFVPGGLPTPNGRVRCTVPALGEALERVESLYDATCRVGDGFLLINRRTARSLNTALANLEQMGGDVFPVRIGPEDAARLNLTDGDEVRLSTDDGEIVAAVGIDDDLRAGVIAMNHGGGSVGDGQPVAAARCSVNVNRIMPQGHAIEPFSGMAHLTGVPVTLTPIQSTAADRAIGT